jgi:hypothetical protein
VVSTGICITRILASASNSADSASRTVPRIVDNCPNAGDTNSQNNANNSDLNTADKYSRWKKEPIAAHLVPITAIREQNGYSGIKLHIRPVPISKWHNYSSLINARRIAFHKLPYIKKKYWVNQSLEKPAAHRVPK